MINKPILVTGVTGYLASWIVKELLEEGYTVHGTVRSLVKEERFEHLKRIESNGKGKLKLFEADLLEPGSFAKAMAGCEYVIHTASPFKISGIKDPYNTLIKPAQEGTINVLEEANKVSSVKRVVLTSSVVAVYGDACDLNDHGKEAFDENMWNTSSSMHHQPYPYSKTLGEKEAWKIFEAQNRWSLVVINPGFIMGPSLTPFTESTSFEIMANMGNGEYKMGVPQLYFGIVDVRDVALAHLSAAFNQNAWGRNILVNNTLDFMAISRILQEKFSNSYPFPTKYLPKFLVWLIGPTKGLSRKYVTRNVGIPIKFNNEKSLRELSVTYRSVNDTITDHFQQLIDDKLL